MVLPTCPSGRGVHTACEGGWIPSPPPHGDLGSHGPHGVPEVSMDYCFLSKEEGARSLTVLVTKDRGSKGVRLSRTRSSRQSPMSGGSGIWGR